jgi:hypothetical protein
LLLHLLCTAERKPGLPPRFRRIDSTGDQFSRVLVQVEAQFLFELLF